MAKINEPEKVAVEKDFEEFMAKAKELAKNDDNLHSHNLLARILRLEAEVFDK